MVAVVLRSRLVRRLGGGDATIIAGAAYLLVLLVLGFALPTINHVKKSFQAK